MDRVSVLARRRRIKNLEEWTLYAILTEAFFLALSPAVASTAVVFGVIIWLLRSRIDTHYKLRSLPFDVPVTIFLLMSAISVFMSSARSFDLIYNYCSLVGVYALTYLIVGQTIQTSEQIKLVVQALGASAILVVLWGFFQFAFGVDIVDIKWTDPEAFPELRKRIFSTLENPNVLAGYLDVMICLVLGVLSKAERRSQKLVLIGVIILLATCLMMTYSRGAFIAIAIIFVVYGVLKDWRILILFAAIVGVIAYSDTTFTNRIISTFTMTDSSEGVRVGIWVSTSAMISDHPFTGIGWGAYQYVYPQYNYYVADPDIIIYHAHNIYLNYAAEVGIVGALAFFWYFFGTMFIAFGVSERGFEKWFSEHVEKAFASSTFLQKLSAIVNEKFDAFSNRLLNLFSKKKSRATKKTKELVHHEDLNFSEHTRQKFAEDINVGGENISAKLIKLYDDDPDDELQKINWHNVTKIDYRKFAEGLQFGIGLAFLSMALNGFTDDLLFNIPSSMLMWLLGALAAAINSIRLRSID